MVALPSKVDEPYMNIWNVLSLVYHFELGDGLVVDWGHYKYNDDEGKLADSGR